MLPSTSSLFSSTPTQQRLTVPTARPTLSFSQISSSANQLLQPSQSKPRPSNTGNKPVPLTVENRAILDRLRAESRTLPPKDFDIADLFLRQNSPQLGYFRRSDDKERGTKWGQLKLLISEIAALIYYWDPNVVPDLIVVYAGAAPGHHFIILSKLFPQIREWHLYDPRDSEITATNKIFLYKTYFDDNIASQWTERGSNVFFFCDIRSISHNDKSKPTDEEVEAGVWKDMQAQKRWTEIIKPYQAYLKFRLPYIYHSGSSDKVKYLDGDVLFQCYPPATSSETRLVPRKNENGDYVDVEYSSKVYESMMFRHNAVERVSRRYNTFGPKYDTELDDKYDSAHMIFVLSQYAKFNGEVYDPAYPEDFESLVVNLSRVIRQDLSNRLSKPTNLTEQRRRMFANNDFGEDEDGS